MFTSSARNSTAKKYSRLLFLIHESSCCEGAFALSTHQSLLLSDPECPAILSAGVSVAQVFSIWRTTILNPFGSLLNSLKLLDRSDLCRRSESWLPKQQTTAWWGQSRRPASAAQRALRRRYPSRQLAIARELSTLAQFAGYWLNFSTQTGWASNSLGNSCSSTVTVPAPDLTRSGAVESSSARSSRLTNPNSPLPLTAVRSNHATY